MGKPLRLLLPFLFCFQLSNAQTTQFIFQYDAAAQGNPALMTAVEFAFDIWSNEIVSSVPIVVQVNYVNLGFFAAGNAQTENFQFGFQGAPDPNVKYPMALANEFAQTDLNGSAPEIIMNLNSTTNFYYGTDGNPPANQFDLVSVVLHEACHALGFFSEARVNAAGEGEFAGVLPYIYDTFLVDANGNKLLDIPENTLQLGDALTSGQVFMDGENAKAALGGTRPQISANSFTLGSSISHWNFTTFLGTDNSLMTPATFNGSAQHNVGAITRGQMADMGWVLVTDNSGPSETEITVNEFNRYFVTDVNGGDSDDALSLSTVNGNLRIESNVGISSNNPNVQQLDANTVEIALFNITNSIIFDGVQGDNTVFLSNNTSMPNSSVVFIGYDITAEENGNMSFLSLNGIDNEGSLNLNGATITSTIPMNLSNDSSLFGSGEILGGVNISLRSGLSPGDGTGIISTGDLFLLSNSNFLQDNSVMNAEVNGPASGTQHDQIVVTGTVTLNGVNLNLIGGYTNTSSDEIILIANDGNDVVNGTFDNLQEGNSVNFGDFSGTISYVGGDGNDVVLKGIPDVETEIALDVNGKLLVTDANGGNSDDEFVVSVIGQNLRIQNNSSISISGNGTQQIDANTVEVPLANITNGIDLDGGEGINTVDIDASLNLAGVGNDLTVRNVDVILTGTGTLQLNALNVFENTDYDTSNAITEVTNGANFFSDSGLIGIGTISGVVNMNSFSTVAPGASPGILNTGNLILGTESAYEVEYDATAPGIKYDRINVIGSVTIENDVLLDLNGDFPNNSGEELIIIDNDGTDSVIGSFQGLPEGATINDDFVGTISYVGGDGNDVVLLVSSPIDFSNAFVTTWQTSSGNESITIPTFAGETYDYAVDWGDGNIESGFTADATHTYATSGVHTVSISSVFPRIEFSKFGFTDREKILTVESWGNIQWTSMEGAFGGCVNLDVKATDSPNLSNVTKLDGMFGGCSSLVGNASFADWNMTSITSIASMFAGASSFNVDISGWNTSSIINMKGVFSQASSFNQPVGAWDVGNVTNFDEMFAFAESFNQNLNTWNTGSATIMEQMFSNATSFNGSVGPWNVSNVTNMSGMFENAIAFDKDISAWDISNSFTLDLFPGAGLSIENYDRLLNAWSSLPNLNSQITLDAGNSEFCLGEAARQTLIDTYEWSISDSGKSCPLSTQVTLNANGFLSISDGLQIFADDAFVLSQNGANLRIANTVPIEITGNGIVRVDANTVDVPINLINGSISLSGRGGNNTLDLDSELSLPGIRFFCERVNVNLVGSGILEVGALEFRSSQLDLKGLTIDAPNGIRFENDEGVLEGEGQVNGVLTMGEETILRPGSGLGIITTSGFSTFEDPVIEIEVNGPIPGVEHDQIVVNGAVQIIGGSLSFIGGYSNAPQDEIIIISNDGTDVIEPGTFSGYPEGASVSFGDFEGIISYVGGDGNDVSLTGSDTTAPNLVDFTPMDNAVEVALDGNLILTFDEPVQLSNEQFLNFNILNVTDGRVEANQFYLDIAVNGNVVTVNPVRNLFPNKEYSIGFEENFFQDLSGNAVLEYDGFNSPYSFSTITTTDAVQPKLISISPEDNAIDVPLNSDITLTFDEDIQVQQDPGVFRLFKILGSGVPDPSDIETLEDLSPESTQVTIAGNSVTLDFVTDFEPNTRYLVQLVFVETVLQDTSGNPWFADLEPQFESPGLENLGYIFTTGAAINDTEVPVINCPAPITSTAGSNCFANLTLIDPTATDNVSTNFTYTGFRNDGLALTDSFFVGETIITWTATDEAGNVSESCEQTITVSGTGNCWESVGSPLASDGAADNLDFAKNSTGVPYIAYRNLQNNELTVKRLTAGIWEKIGDVQYADDDYYIPSLAISNNDIPHVAYYDWTLRRHVVKRYVNGIWEDSFGVIQGSNQEFLSAELAFNNLDELHVLYGASGGGLTMEKWTGSTWQPIGPENFSNNTLAYSLAFDAAGIPYVAYQEVDESPQKLTVQRFVSGSWEFVGPERFSQGTSGSRTIAISPNNVPYVAYYDSGASNVVLVKRFNGTVWEDVGSSPYNGSAESISLDFDAFGTPYIGYKVFNLGYFVKRLESNIWSPIADGASIVPLGTYSFSENMQICLDNSNVNAPILYTALAREGIYVKSILPSVLDAEAPIINCPDNLAAVIAETETSAIISLENPTATDNLSTTFTFIGVRSDASPLTDPYPLGDTTITWTATDQSGNTSTSCDQLISVGVAETEIVLDANGALMIMDGNGGTSDDEFNLSVNNGNLRISNTVNFIMISGDGVVQIDANTVEIPLASLTDGLTIDGMDGNDTVILDSSLQLLGNDNGLILKNIDVQVSGTGTLELNALSVTNGDFDTNGLVTTITTEANFFENATLSGTGTIDGTVNMNVNSNLIPGVSPGILNVGDLTLDNSNNDFEINGITPGTEHDQVVVTGTVNINGATLNLLGGYINGDGDEIILIDNDGTDAITGSFEALAEGEEVVFGDFTGTISYVGGDGNDIVLLGTVIPAQRPFVTTWEVIGSTPNIRIPTALGETYNYTVDWGDGTIETNFTDDATHRYDSPGNYTVSITGLFPRIFFNTTISNPNRFYIRTVEQWGDMEWTSFERAFIGCEFLDVTATDTPNLSSVTDLNSMFQLCKVLEGTPEFNSWDVSTITNMNQMFSGAELFDQNISNWQVGEVTNMSSMFSGASTFNQPIGSWDVSKVRGMRTMFAGASSFNQNIDTWNIALVVGTEGMFSNATAFNQPLNSWSVSQVVTMPRMFKGATTFNQPLDNWDVGNVRNMTEMFAEATAFDQNIGTWDIGRLESEFDFDPFTMLPDGPDRASASNMFENAGLSTENYDALLTGWSTLDAGETQIPNGITLNAGSSRYCFSESARQLLTTNFSWNIMDGGQLCPEVEVTLENDGTLSIVDTAVDATDDDFTVSTDGTNLILSNTQPILISGDGIVLVDDFTAQIPLSGITNGLTLEGGGGNNTLSLTTSLTLLGIDNGLTLNDLDVQLIGTEDLQLNALNVMGGDFGTNGLTTTVTTEANFFADATLSGTGAIVGVVNMNVDSNLAPGTSPGIVTVNGNLTLDNNNNDFEVNGVTAGSEHDQVVVSGTVTIVTGTTLNLLGGYTNENGDEIILIDNDGIDTITGTFDGWPKVQMLPLATLPVLLAMLGVTAMIWF